jgi:hypothetical protein
VGKVFTKIVTAPFAALGALFGGPSEHLDIIDFPAGSSEVDARSAKTLQSLSKASYSRPALKLEIQGRVDVTADGVVLRRQALRRRGSRGEAGGDGGPTGKRILTRQRGSARRRVREIH